MPESDRKGVKLCLTSRDLKLELSFCNARVAELVDDVQEAQMSRREGCPRATARESS